MLKPKKTRPKWLVAVGLITVFIITTGVYISMQSGVFGKANDFKIFMTTILFVCLFVAILFAGIKYGLIIGAAAFAIILTTIINANIRWPLIVFVITISVLGPNLYRSLRNYVVRLNIDKPEQINSNMLYLVRNNSAKFDKVFALTEEKDYIRFDYAGGQTHIINQIPTHIRKNHTKSFKLKKSDIDKIVIDTKEKFWQGSLFGQGTVTITINDVSEPFVLHKTNGYKTASRFFADALKSQNSAEIVSVCIDDRIRVIQSEVEFISQQSPKQKQKRKAAEHIALTLNIFGMLSLFMLFWPKMPTALVLLIALIPLGGLGVYIIFSNILTFFETESTSKQGVTFSIICPAITLVSTAIQRFNLKSLRTAIVPVASVAIVLILIVLIFTREYAQRLDPAGNGKTGLLLLIPAFIIVYCYGAVICINCLLDKSTPKVYNVMVVEKTLNYNINTPTMTLTLEPWGSKTFPNEVTVDKDIFNNVKKGQNIAIDEYDGFINIKWIDVRLTND